MLISPQSYYYKNGLKINTYELPIQKESAIPKSIKLYLFKEFKVNLHTSLCEFFTRRAQQKDISIPNYIVDRFSAWNLIIFPTETISIIVCGESSFNNTIKLIKSLAKEFDLGLNQISLNFFNLSFIKRLQSILTFKELELKPQPVIDELIETPTAAQCIPKITFKTYSKGEWKEEFTSNPIEALSFSTNFGEIEYHAYCKNKWMPWIKSNLSYTGMKGYPIKSLAFKFDNSNYCFSYRLTFINGDKTKWINRNISTTFTLPITQVEFQIDQK